MNWLEMLFSFLGPIIDKCLAQGRPEEVIRSSLRAPTRRDWVIVKRNLRWKRIRGEMTRAQTNEILAKLQSQSELVSAGATDVIDDLIEEARDNYEL